MAPPAHPGSSRRQSAMPGHRGASLAYAGRRTDPRPCNDRPYMQACVQNIVSFVVENGYGMPISPKILTNPTSKDFQNIFLFLMRYLDPTFSFEKRFEDEIPALLKTLGYPFTVSKSALSAIGSPHTWPTLLAVLTWLLEMLQYDERKMAREEEAAEDVSADSTGDGLDLMGQTREDRKFLNNVNAAYQEFLAGADEFPALDQAMKEDFEAENAGVREDVDRLQNEIEERGEILGSLRAQPSPLQTLKDHYSSLDSNIRKFKRLIPSLEDHKAGVEAKLAEKNGEIDQLHKSTQAMTSKIEELRAIVEAQEQKSIDPIRIAKDRATLREMLAKLQDERARAEADLKASEDCLSAETITVCDSLRRYHRGAETLLLIPATAKNAGGNDFSVTLVTREDSWNSTHEVLSVDIHREITPSVRELKDGYSQQFAALQADELTLQEKVDAVEEQLMVIRDEHDQQKARYMQYDREYQAEKTAMAEQLKSRSDEKLKREEDILDRRRFREENLRESERNLDALNSQLRSFQENFASERIRVGSLILTCIEKLRAHKAAIHEATQSAAGHFAEETARAQEDDTTVGSTSCQPLQPFSIRPSSSLPA